MIFKSPVNGINIDYAIYPADKERSRILFLTGRAEYYRKYEDLFKELNDRGVSVYTMDHRGQGHSDRMLKDRQIGHVEKFSHYIDDAQFFLKKFVLKDKPDDTEVVSFSHSMGGAVSILLGMRYACFDKMIFSSPMWGINTGKFGKKAVFFLSRLMCALERGENYVVGTGSYCFEAFEKNILTHSKERFEKQEKYLKDNSDTVLGGPSYRWLNESLRLCQYLETSDFVLNAKVLLLQAQEEKVVDNSAQDRIVKKFKNANKISIKNGFHELLNESETILSEVLSEIFSFLEK